MVALVLVGFSGSKVPDLFEYPNVMDDNRGVVAVSVVSHGHGVMVDRLVDQLLECPEVGLVIVTRNIPELHVSIRDTRVIVVENTAPKGFGANHNAAFQRARLPFWCVLNPDVRLQGNPFPDLTAALTYDSAGLVAPLVRNPAGSVEDSIRYFPTTISLVKKIVGHDTGHYPVDLSTSLLCPEWVAGMFMLFRREVYSALNGFDQGYFLYYEDVDICIRTWLSGRKVLACPAVSVEHDARRESHRNARYLKHHLCSMARYFLKHRSSLAFVAQIVQASNLELRNKAK